MTFEEPTLRIHHEFTQLRYDEESRKAVLVFADESDATRCVIRLERYGPEFTFTRETAAADWPYEKHKLERILAGAFEQGRVKQRQLISTMMKTVIG